MYQPLRKHLRYSLYNRDDVMHDDDDDDDDDTHMQERVLKHIQHNSVSTSCTSR